MPAKLSTLLILQVQKVRPDLRVIISSATLEARGLASYFVGHDRGPAHADTAAAAGVSRTPAVMTVEGRTFDVQVSHPPSIFSARTNAPKPDTVSPIKLHTCMRNSGMWQYPAVVY